MNTLLRSLVGVSFLMLSLLAVWGWQAEANVLCAKSCTNNVATNTFQIPNPSVSYEQYVVVCSAMAYSTGSVRQQITDYLGVTVTNDGTTMTATLDPHQATQDIPSGVLTTTYTITAADPAQMTMKVNSSLTQASGYPTIACLFLGGVPGIRTQ